MALRHEQSNPAYNRHLRQLIHVGFKVAAEMGPTYYQALEANATVIGGLVTENLLEKHIKPGFVQSQADDFPQQRTPGHAGATRTSCFRTNVPNYVPNYGWIAVRPDVWKLTRDEFGLVPYPVLCKWS